MLIRFTVKNFASFFGEQSLSMVKGKESRLPHHINKDTSGDFKTLRGAVIYGPNASGKSNLIQAMNYAYFFIAENRKKDRAEQFRLDDTALEQPSSFNFEFKIDNRAYSYGFESKGVTVVREWLYEIFTDRDEKLLFERAPKTGEKAEIKFGSSVEKEIKNKTEWADIQAIARTTPDDVLFLHDAKRRNINIFKSPLSWFETKLRILNPESIEPFITTEGKLIAFLDKLLKAADVGITGVHFEKDEDIAKIPMPIKLAEKLNTELTEEGDTAFVVAPNKMRYVISREKGKLCSHRLVTRRRKKSGEEVHFELTDESDGTRRLIDLAPIFLSEDALDRVIVIDEMDRSLHPMITEMLHDLHYNDPARVNGQMILATHEHYLLSQEFYRRDEIWFVEKDEFGASKLTSLSEFKARHDKDIEKDYLMGRYGATPYVRKLNG